MRPKCAHSTVGQADFPVGIKEFRSPAIPAQISAGSQPDFYMMWTDGLARLMPPWEIYLGGYTISAAFWVAIIVGLVLVVIPIYPWIEKRLTRDTARHNPLQRPRDVPVRTAIGAMAIAFHLVLTFACVNDIIALKFDVSLNATTWFFRIALLLLPPLAYAVTYRFRLGLQRSDRAVLEHGIKTGIIKRLPHGEYIEVHQSLGPVDAHGHPIPLAYQGAAVPKKMSKLGSAGKPGTGGFLIADSPEERAALDVVHHHEEQAQLAMLKAKQDTGSRG
ncbi:putative menaquinol-cytochrome c reductase cytochrome b subunit [Nocardia seriolae]|uniref:Menaquinol-cytochrome C reductase n=1 Tax=Nocardia seriolae TaxID=37332 RepID=A0ABC9YKD5_9NOCA|nr:putative menaquinol-cytochrome c reductase cytochrome b subunit [Nocardia seriolae]BAW10053.1 menaquinol-cytochrome C reductase [Nocardia seriolae]BEK85030.1 hypothetical protein NSERKGN1266_09810 [Nocardia seriolae]BEK99127.1 hypothetical protein NSER024013_70330 [Nocardia seriolae]GAM44196.1 menaquinol-cytochrome C reductase [Nocardia seriolae]